MPAFPLGPNVVSSIFWCQFVIFIGWGSSPIAGTFGRFDAQLISTCARIIGSACYGKVLSFIKLVISFTSLLSIPTVTII